MGTTARIAAKTGDKFRVIYNNFDGYPSHLLKVLKEHYADDVKVQKLIDLGDVSCVFQHVDPPVGCSHSYEKPYDDVTIAYGRDRGETGVEYRTYDTFEMMRNSESDRYFYYWDGEKWAAL